MTNDLPAAITCQPVTWDFPRLHAKEADLMSRSSWNRSEPPGWMVDSVAAELSVPGDAPFYLLACLECGDPERPLPMPFGSPAERGKWASEHTRATGHDRWRVWEEACQ